ncbi:hypothetical protein RHABOEDO_000244 [Candidatus Rhabdochlamydia oedothoracis]|uniref:Uncharacterized protein n=1 Tax=Candidatus Rhabdochlamydia oedothoracis TaxID=2720720 RepID=A0ABX8UYZ4_9BACT|nr:MULTISPECIES: hypothetical protein [Rhabdochlamydia]KAG6558956.1 hypothetical protein RHOW815_001054 [Candidatus Rhabdochlamydia sp. W815]QYF48141.1 hypothetical protein RHABOEDO_000244 [Candidatus Rhabdochlamydia oedothoracis]
MGKKKFVNLKHSIGTIINFCSYDFAFLSLCIQAAQEFSTQIIVPVCDHMFSGEKEDSLFLQKVYALFPDVQFIEFPFNISKKHDPHYWHNLSRLIGSFFLQKEIQYVLFLDCDEIVDTSHFIKWLEHFNYTQYTAIRLANYWYFRSSSYQATNWEDTPLFLKKTRENLQALMHPQERAGTYFSVQSEKKRMCLSLDKKPMVHHFSWVRTKEQMLKKVSNWGHRKERNWKHLVEQEFCSSFQGTDFVHGYCFETVDPFTIDLSAQPLEVASNASIVRLKAHEVHCIDLSIHFEIDLPQIAHLLKHF